ncbi:hypothetical protein MnTg02_01978 [bacterium MnTg02]|nr:hypothetical protein MnTg02_01978 [bacterium MnTg02]
MTDLSRIEFDRINAAIVVAQYDGSERCNKVSEFRTKMSAYGDCRINNNDRSITRVCRGLAGEKKGCTKQKTVGGWNSQIAFRSVQGRHLT